MITAISFVLVYVVSVVFLRWITSDIQEENIDNNLTFKSDKRSPYTALDLFLIYFPVANTMCGLICIGCSTVWLVKDYFKKNGLLKK